MTNTTHTFWLKSNRFTARKDRVRLPACLYSITNLAFILTCLSCIGASGAALSAQIPLQSQFKNVDMKLRAKIAQKLIIDLRYYCAPKVEGYCQQPLVELPDEIATMLAKSQVGGVILFSENLSSAAQIVKLNHDLQNSLKPLFLKTSEAAEAAEGTHSLLAPQALNEGKSPDEFVYQESEKPQVTEQKADDEHIQSNTRDDAEKEVNANSSAPKPKDDILTLAVSKTADVKQQGSAKKLKDQPAKPLYIPLYIGIDQEGGRVSRLPQSEFLGFAGNMAIGATAKAHDTKFATATSLATAKHLRMLGINLNFAPVLDVNNNPSNPIINVRSYGQYPNLVSDLGGASILSMQQQNISVAAKHFPGHGDTFIDSHVGLPRVDHSRDKINSIDLLPFRKVITSASTRPDMIMTAHIQYPLLDNTRFVGDKVVGATSDDEKTQADAQTPVLPATLSKKILTGILRDELAYGGLIVTDALNMKAITQYLTPIEAVIQSFAAGADITLMPYHISSPEDAIRFLDWLNELTIFIAQDNELKALVEASYNRIIAHKAKRNIAKRTLLPLSDKLALLEDTAYKTSDYNLAIALSRASFTQIKALSMPLVASQNLLVVMPDKLRCDAFTQYWQEQSDAGNVHCISVLSEAIPKAKDRLEKVDAIIIGDASPQLAFYESNEYEGIVATERIDNILQLAEIDSLIAQANAENVPTILVKLRSPYITLNDVELYSGIFASYDYQVVQTSNVNNPNDAYLFSPAFSSLVNVLNGTQLPLGTLPVTLPVEVIEALPKPEKKTPQLPDEL